MTSGLAFCTRRMIGSVPATGNPTHVCTVRATLVPSTSTCSTVRCSLSVARIATASSGILALFLSLYCRVDCSCLLASSALLAIELSGIHIFHRRGGTRRWCGRGRDAFRRDQHHQFRLALLLAGGLKKVTDDRDVAESRNLICQIGHAVIHETGDDEALSILHFELGVCFTRAQGGNHKAGNGEGVGEIQRAYFGLYMQMNVAVGHDLGREFQLHAEFLELNGYAHESLPGLHHGERKFAAGQEACFLAIDCNQVRLSQNLQQILLLQGLDHRTQVNIRTEQKNVQHIIEGLARLKRRMRTWENIRNLLRTETTKLLRADCSYRIRCARGKDVNAVLEEG